MKVAVLVAMLLLPIAASAQTPPRPSPTAAQDGFVPVDKPASAQDSIPAPRRVALAYGFIWVALFGYVWSIRTRLAKVQRELDAVGKRVAAGERRP